MTMISCYISSLPVCNFFTLRGDLWKAFHMSYCIDHTHKTDVYICIGHLLSYSSHSEFVWQATMQQTFSFLSPITLF